jgi:hypothetical protein
MSTVIGLLWSEENVASSIHKLRRGGFDEDQIKVLTRNSAVQMLLSGNQSHIGVKYASEGALVGGVIFGLIGLALDMCACWYLLGHWPTFRDSETFALAGAGVVFGAFVGWFIGTDKMERATHLYTQGVRQGAALVVVQTSDELAPQVMTTLQQANAMGVRVYLE